MWKKLEDELPPKPSANPVVLYHPTIDDMPMTSLHGDLPFRTSNRSYARCTALKDGFTHWMEVPPLTQCQRPWVVCLCGSTRFSKAFWEANLAETLAGHVVLSVGCDFKSDDALGLGEEVKKELDELHLRKIDMADEVLILNVGGYIGPSTARELAYARKHKKEVRFLEPEIVCRECGEAYPTDWVHGCQGEDD